MSAIFYYLLIKPLSLLPMSILYLLSDGIYFILYRTFKYRKKVVWNNISNSFPEKSAIEVEKICADFYRHFCDIIVETIRSFSITKEELLRRVKVVNPEVCDAFYKKGQSVILAAGHYNNWEMAATAMAAQVPQRLLAIYKPLRNAFFDAKMKNSRGQLGMELIPKEKNKKAFEEAQEEPCCIILATDQSPSNSKRAYWMEFLNQDTAVLFGVERYAQLYNFPVVFGWVKKVKRGHYEIRFEVAIENPTEQAYGAITEKHTRMLEEEIRQDPTYWLWTHKRWKRKREEASNVAN
ncbi:MAG: lysophospholipid acyltransferase family protein [Chitinophagales bacterium]|nr:lysophospholipid acyltransferase family protein [Chitinophagales bacterium]